MYKRVEPMTVWMDGRAKLELYVETGGVASIAGPDAPPARVTGPQWTVRENGVERALGLPADISQTEADI